MTFTHQSIPWLLEEENPSVSYLVMKNLLNLGENSKELKDVQKKALTHGHAKRILDNMQTSGYWIKPGGGYGPKYRGTVWSLITLAQLGVTIHDAPQIQQACEYYLANSLRDGHFTYNGMPSGTFDCLQGNMCTALLDLGVQDQRLDMACEWLAGSQLGVTSDGQPFKYYAYKCGPNFACGANAKLPCSWGAVKVLLALSKIDKTKRKENVKKAIKLGVDLLFSVDPSTAAYPTRENTPPNRGWWKLGFPVFYVTDLLQLVEVLVNLGYGKDPRLQKSIEFILSKQDSDGKWKLEYDYKGKVWGNFGKKGQPNKFVTYRVLKVLKDLE